MDRVGWLVVIIAAPIVFAVLAVVVVVKLTLAMLKLFVVFAIVFVEVVDEIAVPRRLPS
jgi:hypothetical protein